ncbi:Protein of unknown function [Desulfatibacillum alkenivorans DSM 16219]|jgi:hypothetical protein|uniref:DUF2889 domain-containing protein n=1 Tax=Desulfatibacillum alkenivorans DSM 16219 TaxID=1121393 RepID=A0A1M6DL51_9BACT|nr:DUF2889 domain-containing protein [Desulfatibacillum alkenivorans]SHI73900.1 Protein of unknown function [Desulfatibacillum alkenivorans DSM 16219]
MASSSLKDVVENAKPVHTRKLEVASYPAPDGNVVVEGWLRDERYVGIYRGYDAEIKGPGPVHGMCVRFLVGDYPITILDAEAEMPTIPNEHCIEIKDSVKKVIGEKITSGYSERIRHLLKGTKGCTHLTHLMVVMGPAALHGFWTLHAQNPRPIPKTMDEVGGLEYLINSCHLWAEDGLHMQAIRDAVEKAALEDGK